MKVKMDLPVPQKIIKQKGLDKDGAVQMFHTLNVLRRIKNYMPMRSGKTFKIIILNMDNRVPEIKVPVAYGQMLYDGKVRIDPKINAAGFLTPEGWRSRKGCHKIKTGRNLKFSENEKNLHPGPNWDERLVANEGKALAADLQAYIDRRSKK